MKIDLAILNQSLNHFLHPEDNIIVTGKIQPEQISSLKQANIDVVVNLLTQSEMAFDEKTLVESAGLQYFHLPIQGADDLKQLNIMQFDQIMRQTHGKNLLIHCQSGNRVGAVVALRMGWLRSRKMETALERGKAHGLQGLEQEVINRLLVPR